VDELMWAIKRADDELVQQEQIELDREMRATPESGGEQDAPARRA
jgi:hypothetical protein